MASKTRSHLTLIAKIAVAVLLIAYMVRSGLLDPKNLWALATPLNLTIAIALAGINIFLAAWRWILLLQARGMHLTLKYGFGLYLIGVFFNYAIPGSVGGDLVRGYYLVKDYPEGRLDSVLSIVIDRVLGLYSFFILTLMAVVWDFDFVMGHDQIRWVAMLCLIIFSAMTGFFLVVFSESLSRATGLTWISKKLGAVHRMVEAFHRFGKNRQMIAFSVLVSLVGQGATMVFFYLLAQASGETAVTWKAVLFAVPMGFLCTAIPIAPAGIGVGQVAFAYLFSAYLQKTTQFGANAITAFQLTVIAWAMVGAVIYLKRRNPKDFQNIADMAESPAP